MTIEKKGTLLSVSYYMEMTYHVRSFIDLRIASDCTPNEIFNELIFIDGMGECYYANYVYNIMII